MLRSCAPVPRIENWVIYPLLFFDFLVAFDGSYQVAAIHTFS